MDFSLAELLDPRILCGFISVTAFTATALAIRYWPRKHMVFMNYRKADTDFPDHVAKHGTSQEARALTDELRKLLPDCRVLLDVDDIDLGSDWRVVLKTLTQQSSALVCLVGKQWMTVAGNDGTRRLFQPNDIVREELVAALDHGVKIFPLLVNGGTFPQPGEFPKALDDRSFGHRQFHKVDSDWRNIEDLRSQLGKLVTNIRKHMVEIESLERPAQTLDFIKFTLIPLLTLWFSLVALSWGLSSPWLVCLFALAAAMVALVAVQYYKSILIVRLIHDTRCREPDFNWLQAYQEYGYCAWLAFGQQTVQHVARVRVESAVVHTHPEEPIPEDDARLEDKSQSKYLLERKDRDEKLREAASIAVKMKVHPDGTHVRPTLTVGTCFDLHSASSELKRYLTMVRQKSQSRKGEFYSEVKIEQGFLSPQFLTTGLMDHFEENWEPVLNWYGEAVEQTCPRFVSKALQRVQVFEFLCWLTWGPSVPHCQCDQWRSHQPHQTGGVFLQFGYGDENNSFLLCDHDKTVKSAQAFLEEALAADPNSRAIQCEATIIPVLVSDVKESLCFAQADAAKQGGVILRAAKITPFSSQQRESNRRIYQAYVWMMFVLCDPNGEPLFPNEPWRGLFPFFTHGNIAEPDTYRFIREEVARKSVEAIKSILTHSPYVTFRFACSSDVSNCGRELMFPPAMPTMLECFVKELLTRLTKEEQACVIIPNAARLDDADYRKMHHERADEDGFQGIYSSCHLPDRLREFYQSLASEEEDVDANAPTFYAVTATLSH